MKKWCMAVALMFFFSSGQAQTFNEWFKQKKTQINYLIQQIAALQVYIEFAQKGYKIVDKGLTVIGNIKRGDLNLHTDFFGALKGVNPKIRNSALVADMIVLQINILQAQKKALKKARSSEQLTEKEVQYIVRVYFRLLEQTADNLERLTLLITNNELVLSDDERLTQIGALHSDMQDKLNFARWFADETDVLIGGRAKEASDVQKVGALIHQKE